MSRPGPWNTRPFRHQAPYQRRRPPTGDGKDRPLPTTVIADLEAYLAQVAREYKRLGFRAPALEPVVERDDGTPLRSIMRLAKRSHEDKALRRGFP